jgi:hypothetical protein
MECVGHATHGWRMEGHHSCKYNRKVKTTQMIWNSRMPSSSAYASENLGICPTQKLFYE